MSAQSNLLPLPASLPTLGAELGATLSAAAVVRVGEPMARRTTLRVGGPADIYVEPGSEPDLAAVLRWCGENRLPFFLLGRGSNLLVKDGGIRGVVICLAHAAFSRVAVDGERLLCGAGARLKLVANTAREHGLAGLEFLEGIPGTVGGALRMNAGAMGSWIFALVERVRVMSLQGEITERAADQMEAVYRECRVLKDHIALLAVLRAAQGPRERIQRTMDEFSRRRWSSQPAAPSAGCIFKNPREIAAGKLIDELGLKGTRVGGAVVSAEHGNFIVNDGNATARDVLELIELLRRRARETRGIELETEVEIVGE